MKTKFKLLFALPLITLMSCGDNSKTPVKAEKETQSTNQADQTTNSEQKDTLFIGDKIEQTQQELNTKKEKLNDALNQL